jgi:hypothetical protein
MRLEVCGATIGAGDLASTAQEQMIYPARFQYQCQHQYPSRTVHSDYGQSTKLAITFAKAFEAGEDGNAATIFARHPNGDGRMGSRFCRTPAVAPHLLVASMDNPQLAEQIFHRIYEVLPRNSQDLDLEAVRGLIEQVKQLPLQDAADILPYLLERLIACNLFNEVKECGAHYDLDKRAVEFLECAKWYDSIITYDLGQCATGVHSETAIEILQNSIVLNRIYAGGELLAHINKRLTIPVELQAELSNRLMGVARGLQPDYRSLTPLEAAVCDILRSGGIDILKTDSGESNHPASDGNV